MIRILAVAAFLILAAVPTLGAAHNQPPQPSNTPSCFACPQIDTAGFPLGVNSDNNGVLFCSYPTFPGEDPNNFFCRYNDHDGTLIEDENAGFCPPHADQASCHHRRDDNFKAMKRRAVTTVRKQKIKPT